MDPTEDADPLPTAAALLGLDVPDVCRPGVRLALEGLAEHLRLVEGFVVPVDTA